MAPPDINDAIKEAFKMFDTNCSGTVSVKEFREMMTTYGAQMSEEEFNEIIQGVGVDSDGQIDLDGNLVF